MLQNDLASAMTHYDRAIAADPLSAEAFANKGKALADMGHHEYAVEVLQKAVSMRGTSNAVAMLNLGKCATVACGSWNKGDKESL